MLLAGLLVGWYGMVVAGTSFIMFVNSFSDNPEKDFAGVEFYWVATVAAIGGLMIYASNLMLYYR